jgi:ADP-heptose:LPS heptosyltransferase
MQRILVVNVNWLGDVIFSSPVFKALKEAYPEARISCMAVPRVRDVLESIPCIDEIITYDEKGRHGNPIAKLKLIMQLRRKRFDIAFLLHRSLTRALLVYCAGIPVRVGYDEKNRGQFLTHKVNYLEGQVHRSDHYLNIIESYGVAVRDRQCRLNVGEDAQKGI